MTDPQYILGHFGRLVAKKGSFNNLVDDTEKVEKYFCAPLAQIIKDTEAR